MKLHELKPAANATALSKRIGRGQGSGKGGTSTKGHKGAQSRTGYSRKIGFEGGQMPIYRLLPKRGFKNINRVEYDPINVGTLQQLVDKTQETNITLALLFANGLISKKSKIKILGNGELTAKITVEAHAFSKSAIAAIEKLGGKALEIGVAVIETPANEVVAETIFEEVKTEVAEPVIEEVTEVVAETVIEVVNEPVVETITEEVKTEVIEAAPEVTETEEN